jgi:hypothetical protein
MKRLILIVVLALSINVYAEDDKTVTLVVSGQGKTQDEAKQNALRSAIEQAFGTFISSKTEILNDNLLNDEVVSITNGNIQSFKILKENQLPDGTWTTMINTIVSINKLTSFYESKGVKIEFSGGLFAQNIEIQKLNKKSEKIAWVNVSKVIEKLVQNCFDYEMSFSDPYLVYEDRYAIPITINVTLNKNLESIKEILNSFCSSVSMPNHEMDSYKKRNEWYFGISLEKKSSTYYFRNVEVANDILSIPWQLSKAAITNFTIVNDIDKYNINDLLTKRDRMIEFIIPEKGPMVSKTSYNQLLDRHTDRKYLDYQLFGDPSAIIEIGYEKINETYVLKAGRGTKFSSSLSGIFSPIFYQLLDKMNEHRYSNFINPLNPAPFLYLNNLSDSKIFLKMKFVEFRDLLEMKKIKEYKISPTEQLN